MVVYLSMHNREGREICLFTCFSEPSTGLFFLSRRLIISGEKALYRVLWCHTRGAPEAKVYRTRLRSNTHRSRW